MSAAVGEVVTSLKSIYGEKWRQGLLVHIIIGIGRGLIKRSQGPKSLPSGKGVVFDEDINVEDGAISELQKNPLSYVRLGNEKLADELETQLRAIRKDPVKTGSTRLYPDSGELMEAIGIQARLRLEGNGNNELATLLESVIQVVWEDASPAAREDTLRILRLVSFFSSSI